MGKATDPAVGWLSYQNLMKNKNRVLLILFFAVISAAPVTASAGTVPSPSYLEATQEIKTPEELSKFLKKKFKFVLDEKHFDSVDYWQSPEEFWQRKKGDCEDYALFSKAILEKLGYEANIISLYGGNGYAHTVTIFKTAEGWNVMNEDRLYRYKTSTLEEAVTRIFPDWTWASIAKLQGTRGWLVRELHNPSLFSAA